MSNREKRKKKKLLWRDLLKRKWEEVNKVPRTKGKTVSNMRAAG
ncbi:hypothetical protein [Salisediminibacterium beveridgei]|nr:hypothetical protein [Salisediminibacterium beveridgei]